MFFPEFIILNTTAHNREMQSFKAQTSLIDVERSFSLSLWFTDFRKLAIPFPNVTDTVSQPDQA